MSIKFTWLSSFINPFNNTGVSKESPLVPECRKNRNSFILPKSHFFEGLNFKNIGASKEFKGTIFGS